MADLREIEARITAPAACSRWSPRTCAACRCAYSRTARARCARCSRAARAHGDKEYLVYGDERVSYAQAFARASAFAHALRERYEVKPGDRVAILAANRPEWVLAFWAAVSVGGVVAALNGWWTEDEIRYGVGDADPAVLIGDRARLARLRGQGPGVPVLEIESQFAALEAEFAGRPMPEVEIAEDDPAVILYTSGTTGRPKGAVNTHRGICGFVTVSMYHGVRSMIYAAEAGRKPNPNAPPQNAMLVTVPLFHLSGLYSGCVMMLAAGAKTVYRPGRFDPEDALRLIERERITSWPALGNMPHRVVSHPGVAKYDLSSMSNVGGGGGPTSPEIQRRLREVFPGSRLGMGLGYGLSESVTAVAMITGDELLAHPTSVGRPVATHEIEVRDGDGKPLPEGVEGEIYIKSPYLMREYWRKPEATSEALLPGPGCARATSATSRTGASTSTRAPAT